MAFGTDFYIFDWRALDEFIPPVSDIRPLESVWNDFESQNISLQIKERKFNTLRSATGLITMAAIALSIATGGRSVWYLLLYGVAITISLIFFIKAYLDSSKIPQKRQQLNRQFQREYICPHCGHFLGTSLMRYCLKTIIVPIAKQSSYINPTISWNMDFILLQV